MWKNKNLKVSLNITTYCNAGCIQCNRTDILTGIKKDWIPLSNWTIDDFIVAFPESDCSDISEFEFCGDFGEPALCPDLLEIIKYCYEKSSANIVIRTNGSIKSTEWWKELGLIGKKRLKTVFAVEGIDQEMHEHYRIRTNLNKILNNMKEYSKTDAVCCVQIIPFEHNENYIDQIIDLCRENGATCFEIKTSNRFKSNNVDEIKFIGSDFNVKTLKKTKRSSDNFIGKLIQNHTSKQKFKNTECRWGQNNRVSINLDGSVTPCCYHGTNLFDKRNIKNYKIKNSLFAEYDYVKFNIFNNSIHDIINSNFFQKEISNSLNTKNECSICTKFCTNKIFSEKEHCHLYIID